MANDLSVNPKFERQWGGLIPQQAGHLDCVQHPAKPPALASKRPVTVARNETRVVATRGTQQVRGVILW